MSYFSRRRETGRAPADSTVLDDKAEERAARARDAQLRQPLSASALGRAEGSREWDRSPVDKNQRLQASQRIQRAQRAIHEAQLRISGERKGDGTKPAEEVPMVPGTVSVIGTIPPGATPATPATPAEVAPVPWYRKRLPLPGNPTVGLVAGIAGAVAVAWYLSRRRDDEQTNPPDGRYWRYKVVKQQRGEGGRWFPHRTAKTFSNLDDAKQYAADFAAEQRGVAGTRIVVSSRGGAVLAMYKVEP